MFDWLLERLEAQGFEMYELSNFARPGRRCRHNLRYWTGRPYLGLGPSAHSYLDGQRGANPAHLASYRARFSAPEPLDVFHEVELEDRVFERVFMALRLTEGLDLDEFEAEFSRPLDSFYPKVAEALLGQGWLEVHGNRLRLRPNAYFVSDGVFSEFAP
jgi:oxygen-independent coproporphyrinogen-3 oxidase